MATVTGSRAGVGARLAAGLVHLLTGRGVTLIAQFVTLAIMGRALGPSDFGIIQLGVAVFVYVGFVNDLGLTLLGARDVDARDSGEALSGDLLGMRLALTALALAPIVIVLVIAPVADAGRSVAAILAVGFAVSALNLRWLLQAKERFVWIAAADTAGSVVQLLLTLLLVRGSHDLVGAAIAVISGPVTSTLVMGLVAPIDGALRPRFRAQGRQLLRRALPLGIATIATAVYYSLDSILLGLFRGSEDVGYYAAAYRIVLACLTLPFVAHAASLPIVAKLIHRDPESVTPVLESLSKYVLMLAAPIAVGTTLCATPIVRLAFGPAFEASAVPLRILIWTCVSVSANVPFAVLMLARHRDRAYMTTTIAGAAANATANVAMIPLFGMVGAGATTMVAEVLVLVSIIWITRDVSISVLRKSVMTVAPPTALMALVIAPIRDSIVAVPIGLLVFAFGALILHSVRLSEVRSFAAALRGPAATPEAPA